MKSFEYAAPKTLPEVIDLLASDWGETEVLAGGTDLVTCLKQRIVAPKRVVSLKNVGELRGVEVDDTRVRIGAMTPLMDVAADPQVAEAFPSLLVPIHGIGSRQTIARGTLGGDLCQRPRCWYFRNGFGLLAMNQGKSLVPSGENRYHAIFGNKGPAYFVSPSRLAPALIALGASVGVRGPKGDRTVPCGDLFRIPSKEGEREHNLEPNEVVTYIDIPRKGQRNGAYEIQQRQGMDWPYVAAAVAFAYEGGKVSNARVVLGHVAPVPWDVPDAAGVLNGKVADDSSFAACAEAASKGANPLSQNRYKVQQVTVAVKRALEAAVRT